MIIVKKGQGWLKQVVGHFMDLKKPKGWYYSVDAEKELCPDCTKKYKKVVRGNF